MITLTKEWLLKTIAELEADRDAVPGVVNEDATMALAAMKRALASLEAEKNAEPVAKVENVGVCWYADNGVPRKPAVGTELYTAPPAPVSLPDGYRLQPISEYDAMCAAILQGAERVTTAYKLPEIGWLRADYQDDNRGLRGNAPLFVLGKKDPSSVWGLDYIPLTAKSPVIPDGWVLVPEEPTHEMLEAGDEQFGTYDVYRRMVAASPQQK